MSSSNAQKRAQKFFFRYFPDFLTFPLMRKMINIRPKVEEDIVIKIAETQQELEQSFQLVQSSYADAELLTKDDNKTLRVNKYHALPTTAIIILKKGETVIATCSIITSNRYPLPLESHWNIDHIKKSGRTGEVSSLAVHKEYRKMAGVYTVPLMIFLAKYSFKYMGIRNFVISVKPIATIFYRAMFNFQFIDKKVITYEFVNNAEAQALHMDLNYWQTEAKRLNLFHDELAKLYKCEESYYNFPKSKYYCALGKILSPELLDYFFIKKTSTFAQMNDDDSKFLREVYNFDHYKELDNIESESRFFIYCNADLIIDNQVLEFDTYAVNSKNVYGKLYKDKIKSSQKECAIKLDISRYETIILQGSIELDQEYIKIQISPNNEWKEFISYVEKKYYIQKKAKKVAA